MITQTFLLQYRLQTGITYSRGPQIGWNSFAVRICPLRIWLSWIKPLDTVLSTAKLPSQGQTPQNSISSCLLHTIAWFW